MDEEERIGAAALGDDVLISARVGLDTTELVIASARGEIKKLGDVVVVRVNIPTSVLERFREEFDHAVRTLYRRAWKRVVTEALRRVAAEGETR